MDPTNGLGFLGRTLFEELSKLEGIPGWLLSAAIASSTTVVMGYAAVRWFDKGQKLSSEVIKKLTREVTGYLLGSLRNLGKHEPGQEGLQVSMMKSLENLPIANSQEELEREAWEGFSMAEAYVQNENRPMYTSPKWRRRKLPDWSMRSRSLYRNIDL